MGFSSPWARRTSARPGWGFHPARMSGEQGLLGAFDVAFAEVGIRQARSAATPAPISNSEPSSSHAPTASVSASSYETAQPQDFRAVDPAAPVEAPDRIRLTPPARCVVNSCRRGRTAQVPAGRRRVRMCQSVIASLSLRGFHGTLLETLFPRKRACRQGAGRERARRCGRRKKSKTAQSEASAAAQSDRNEKPARVPVAKAESAASAEPRSPGRAAHHALRGRIDEGGRRAARGVIAEAKAAVAAPQAAAPPPLSAPRAPAAAEPASQKMAPLLKDPKSKAETPKKAEPAKAGAAAAPRPAPAPAQKAAPPPRAATDEAPRPKRAPKDTLPAFRAPAVPSAPEVPAAQNASQTLQAGGAQPLAAEVEAAVDTLLDPSAPSSPNRAASDEAADQRAVAETFAAVVKVHAHPLRDFMFQLVGRSNAAAVGGGLPSGDASTDRRRASRSGLPS